MQQRVFFYTYSFILGVAAAVANSPGPEVVWPLYGAAAIFGALGWGLAIARDRGARKLKNELILLFLVFSAVPFGYARMAERSFIPPFDESAETNHIKSLIEKFPDSERRETTRLVGRIAEEPEFRPRQNTPGTLSLVIEPYEVEPEPGSGKKYKISEGNLLFSLRPSRHFSPERAADQQFKAAFESLARPEAYGSIVEIEAQFEGFRPAENPGIFDAAEFYNDQDVYASSNIYFWPNREGEAEPIRVINGDDGRPLRDANMLVDVALKVKEKILAVTKLTVPFPESAFLGGVTVGARRGLDGVKSKFEEPPQEGEPDLRQLVLDQFRWSGTSHVLAVSGLHVSIIAGSLWGIFILLKIPKKVYAPLIVLALTIFCLITGARPSTLRAVIMNSLVILTYVYLGAGFRASLFLAIGVSGFAILLENPRWLTKPAFALSFMAVLSLGLISGSIENVCRNIPGMRRLPIWLQQFIYAQGAIQLGMMWPLSAFYFTRVSIAGPFANFLAIPLIGVIVQLGLFAGLIGMIPGVGLYAALVMNAANYVMCWIFLWSAHISTVLMPFPMVQTFSPRMLAAYYFLLSLFIWHQPLLRHARILYYDLVMQIGGSGRRNLALAVFGGAFILISSVTVFGFWPREASGEMRVTFLAVRYGSSVHVETPGGAHILIDAGPNDYRFGWNTGERTVAQYLLKDRIGSLDAVVMTGVSPEDVGGIASILNIFPVKRFYSPIPVWDWDPDDPAAFKKTVVEAVNAEIATDPRNADFDETLYHLDQLAWEMRSGMDANHWIRYALISPTSIFSRSRPTPYRVKAGDVIWREPDAPGGVFEIIALHPDPDDPSEFVNDNSLVLKVRYGNRSILLPGDVTEEGIRKLKRISPELLAADALLVPAQGSPKSNDHEFFETVLQDKKLPRYGIISFSYARNLKPDRGRSAKFAKRESFLSHRQLYYDDIEAGASGTEEDLKRMGVTVARMDRTGAVICRSNGSDFVVETMIEDLSATAEEGSEDLERHREF